MVDKVYATVLARVLLMASLLLVTVGATVSCRGDNQGDEQELGVQLLGVLGSCSLAGVAFKPDTGVTCASNSASGSGNLTALARSGDILSVELSFSVQSGGSLELLAGANTAANGNVIGRGFGLRFTNSGASAVGPFDVGAEVGELQVAPGRTVHFCLELRLDRSPPRLIAKNAACPLIVEPALLQLIDDSYRTGSASTHRGWGFILDRATIKGIIFNQSARFSEAL